jgi:hypothetical protein
MTHLGWDFQKRKLDGLCKQHFKKKTPQKNQKIVKFPQKEILTVYVSRSCSFSKVKMGRCVAYIIIYWDQISFFGNFDGLYN